MSDDLAEELLLWLKREGEFEEFYIQWKYLLTKEKVKKWLVKPFDEIWSFFINRGVSKKNIKKVICSLKLHGMYQDKCEDEIDFEIKNILIKSRNETKKKLQTLALENQNKRSRLDEITQKITKLNDKLSHKKSELRNLMEKSQTYQTGCESILKLKEKTDELTERISKSVVVPSTTTIHVKSNQKFSNDEIHRENNDLVTKLANLNFNEESTANLTKLNDEFKAQTEAKFNLKTSTYISKESFSIIDTTSLNNLTEIVELFNKRSNLFSSLGSKIFLRKSKLEDLYYHIDAQLKSESLADGIKSALNLQLRDREAKQAKILFENQSATIRALLVNKQEENISQITQTLSEISNSFSLIKQYSEKLTLWCEEFDTCIDHIDHLKSAVSDNEDKIHTSIKRLLGFYSEIPNFTHGFLNSSNMSLESSFSVSEKNKTSLQKILNQFFQPFSCLSVIKNKTFQKQLLSFYEFSQNKLSLSVKAKLMNNAIKENNYNLCPQISPLNPAYIGVLASIKKCENCEEMQEIIKDLRYMIAKISIVREKLSSVEKEVDEWWTTPAFTIFDEVINREST